VAIGSAARVRRFAVGTGIKGSESVLIVTEKSNVRFEWETEMRKFVFWILIPMVCYGTVVTLVEPRWLGLLVMTLMLVGDHSQGYGNTLRWRR